ncbi:unnamed protein product, partial [Ectocarpus sp. 8 AP-2014]
QERHTSAVQCIKGENTRSFRRALVGTRASNFKRGACFRWTATRGTLPSYSLLPPTTGSTQLFGGRRHGAHRRIRCCHQLQYRQQAVPSAAPEKTCQETARSKSTTAVAAVAAGLEQSVRM